MYASSGTSAQDQQLLDSSSMSLIGGKFASQTQASHQHLQTNKSAEDIHTVSTTTKSTTISSSSCDEHNQHSQSLLIDTNNNVSVQKQTKQNKTKIQFTNSPIHQIPLKLNICTQIHQQIVVNTPL